MEVDGGMSKAMNRGVNRRVRGGKEEVKRRTKSTPIFPAPIINHIKSIIILPTSDLG